MRRRSDCPLRSQYRSFSAVLLLLLLLAMFTLGAKAQDAPVATVDPASAPTQPVPFSHRKHVGMKLACNYCHTNPDHGVQMTLPPVATCMACHTSVATDKPAIQTLTGIANTGKQVPWVQVYGVPGFVFWSHDTHLQAKVQCNDCHGDVAQMDAIYRATNVTTMGGCVACHKQRSAPTGCMSCHEVTSSHLLFDPLPASLQRLVGLQPGMWQLTSTLARAPVAKWLDTISITLLPYRNLRVN